MINLTPKQKAVLQVRIKAAKKWGFSHAFLQLNEDDRDAKIEHWAVYDLNGRLIQDFRRVKMEEFETSGCSVRV